MLERRDEHGEHHEEQERRGERGSDEEVAPQRAQFALARLALDIRALGGAIRFEDPIAGVLHHVLEPSGVRLTWEVAHRGALGSEVDAGRQDAVGLLQLPLHATTAVGAGHAGHAERDLADDGLVTSLLHGLEEASRRGDSRVEAHRRAFRGEVDGSVLHAFHPVERALDPRHAAGASHAFHAYLDRLHLHSHCFCPYSCSYLGADPLSARAGRGVVGRSRSGRVTRGT